MERTPLQTQARFPCLIILVLRQFTAIALLSRCCTIIMHIYIETYLVDIVSQRILMVKTESNGRMHINMKYCLEIILCNIHAFFKGVSALYSRVVVAVSRVCRLYLPANSRSSQQFSCTGLRPAGIRQCYHNCNAHITQFIVTNYAVHSY